MNLTGLVFATMPESILTIWNMGFALTGKGEQKLARHFERGKKWLSARLTMKRNMLNLRNWKIL